MSVEEAGLVIAADADALPAEDLGGQDDVLAQENATCPADGSVDLDRFTRWRRRQRRLTSGTASWRSSAARSAADRWERTDLSRTPAIRRWMTSVSAQDVTVTPEQAGPPELLTCHLQIPRRWHHPVELHRPRHHLNGRRDRRRR
ncbi:hypothetical protein [Micromonospora sp. NPDC005206]|uniref:hypothetical protein n=1 Tax=Micromonospora sp. NPDC005206 TaxID=3157022 RepID=UPI0033B2EEE0